MSAKPKYLYKLSIYSPEVGQCSPKAELTSNGWYLPLGIGEKAISLSFAAKSSVKTLTTKGNDLLGYASSLEGTVKLGVIGSSACLGAILTLILNPRGKIRKLSYPTALFATSSAICYPSTAYALSKTTAVNVYNYSKAAKVKVTEWQSSRRLSDTVEDRPEITERTTYGGSTLQDIAPILNAPKSDTSLEGKESASDVKMIEGVHQSTSDDENFSGSPTLEVPKDSIQDMGQSQQEDSDLYTTR